jgi:hypothetical protein
MAAAGVEKIMTAGRNIAAVVPVTNLDPMVSRTPQRRV